MVGFRMKKRLRKKLRRGEFQELGFEVQFRLPDNWIEADLTRFWESFITEAIEREGLMCGGASGLAWNITVTRARRGSATQADRAKLSQWLTERPAVSDLIVGPLVDVWHAA